MWRELWYRDVLYPPHSFVKMGFEALEVLERSSEDSAALRQAYQSDDAFDDEVVSDGGDYTEE